MCIRDRPKTDAEQVVILVLASHGMLDEVPLAEQRARTAAFVRQFHADVSGTMDAITATGKLTPEQTDTILNAWKEMCIRDRCLLRSRSALPAGQAVGLR